MGERWIQAYGFDLYEVSTHGRVRNKETDRILNGYIDRRGYVKLCLRDDENEQCMIMLSNLVADSFMGPSWREKGYRITYYDGDRANCSLRNLVFKTQSEIVNDEYRSGRRKSTGRLVKCLETGETFESIEECSRVLGISRRAISRCVNNPALKTKDGFSFKSID